MPKRKANFEEIEECDKDTSTLDDLVTLLLSQDVRDEESEEERNDRESLQEWFHELGKTAWKDYRITTSTSQGHTLVVPQLFLLISECLMSHRWSEVAEVLVCLIKDPKPITPHVYPVGMELFISSKEENKDRLLQQFISTIKALSEINSKEVVLHYALYLMTVGKTDVARDQLKSLTRKDESQRQPTDHSLNIDRLLVCYQGLVAYVEFLQIKHRLQQYAEQDRDDMSELHSEADHLIVLADRAITCWVGLQDIPGVWDIFITKLVELLEFKEEETKAEEILIAYGQKNQHNPNTARYLYQFYKRHGAEESKSLKPLQEFCDAVPSHNLATELFQLYMKNGYRPGSVLYLIFDLLDYICWQNKNQPWALLANNLRQIYLSHSDECIADVTTYWQMRATWWPKFHFRVDQANTDHQDLECLTNKAIVAALLLKSDKSFVNEVLNMDLPKDEKDLIKGCLKLKR